MENRAVTRTIQSRGLTDLSPSSIRSREQVERENDYDQIAEYGAIHAPPRTQKRRRLIGNIVSVEWSSLRPCHQQFNSPVITVTACPPSITRSPFTRTRTTPPRAEAWYAMSSVLPRRGAQKGTNAQCAAPV